MHARNRTWPLGSDPAERCRQRTLPVEGGDGSTLSLDFTTGVLDPRLTFTRLSNATFINSQGYVQYADANYVQNSNDVTAAGWGGQNGVARSFDNAVVNPESGLGASLVTASSSIGSSAVSTSSFTVNGGLAYTVSFWIRAGTATQALVGVYDPSIPPSGGFAPASAVVISGPGTATGSSSIVVSGLTSSWTRVRIYLSPAYSGVRAVSIYPDAALASGKSIYIWGVKWEAGHVANPTPITTGATAYYAPRFDYDPTSIGTPRGLLIEASANNIVFRSQQLNTSPWLNAGTMTVSETGSGSPANDATSNVVTWTNGTAAGNAWLRQSVPVAVGSLVVGSAYTWSVWLKARGNQRVAFWAILQGASGNREVRVDFSVSPPTVTSVAATGWTAVQAPSIQEFPNGWYRVTTGGTIPASTTGVFFGFSNSDAVPASGTNGFEAWGYQLESGSGASASSYIPTGASTGNRAADVCYIANADYGFSTSGGTYYVEWSRGEFATIAGQSCSAINTDYTSGRWLGLGTGAGSTTTSIGSWTGVINLFSTAVAGRNKAAFNYSSWGASVTGVASANGSSPQTGTLTLGTTPTYLMIGSASATFPYNGAGLRDFLNNTVRRIKYWPTALANAQLQSLTT